jgi:hypothetical protein
MYYSFIPGPGQPNQEIVMPEGQAVAGFPVGIIVIDIWYPLVPGNVANASTFDFPILYKVLKGASIDQILSGDPALLPLVIEAGHELIQHGARCIVGACGSFAYYQKEAAAAFSVPTFLSSMLQVPLILQSLKPDQKLGVIAASPSSLTEKVFDQCGISDPSRLAITGAKGLPEFEAILQCTGRFNSHKLEQELVQLATKFAADNPTIGALILQCSDLPPYAWAIQRAVQLPVFDMTTLIRWVYEAVVRRPFAGII